MDAPGRTPVRMFFYGTLKRGGSNHTYCGGGRMAAEARVEGSLYDLPQGYPALVVPEGTILAVGTSDYAADARRANVPGKPRSRKPGGPAVHGELYVFDDPRERLPALDALEDFDPENPSSPYRRVLVPVETADDGVTLAWAYAVRRARGTHLPGGRWPA